MLQLLYNMIWHMSMAHGATILNGIFYWHMAMPIACVRIGL